MAIRLDAPGRILPLAFQVDQHLGGEQPGLLLNDKTSSKGKIDKALAREGVGLKLVTIEGFYQPPGEAKPRARLPKWRRVVAVPGTLDADSLARLVFSESRNFIGSVESKKKRTPPEVYVTSISVAQPTEKKPLPKRKPRKEPRVVTQTRYRDSRTGHYVSKEKWARERKRLGKGQRGRYRRTREKRII